MSIDRELEDIAAARYVSNPHALGINSLIASLYNLSCCPQHIESGVAELCRAKMTMFVTLRNSAAKRRKDLLPDKVYSCIGRDEEIPFVSYGDALDILAARRIQQKTVSGWIGKLLCVMPNEYEAVHKGYPALRAQLEKARQRHLKSTGRRQV